MTAPTPATPERGARLVVKPRGRTEQNWGTLQETSFPGHTPACRGPSCACPLPGTLLPRPRAAPRLEGLGEGSGPELLTPRPPLFRSARRKRGGRSPRLCPGVRGWPPLPSPALSAALQLRSRRNPVSGSPDPPPSRPPAAGSAPAVPVTPAQQRGRALWHFSVFSAAMLIL